LRTGIILSGGKSTRLGADKGLIELERKPLVNWVIEKLEPVVSEVIVVVGSLNAVPSYRAIVPNSVRVVCDTYREDSPMIGLITGLKEANGGYAAVCACDMPFIEPNVLEMLYCLSDGLNGTLLLKPNGWVEPFPSIYKVSTCLKYAEQLKHNGELRIRKVLETMSNTAKVPIDRLRSVDPHLRSFIDIDTLDSLEDAKTIIKRENM
jgi:molybdopterin-guanine dinucleotide biosynthesis protein A